MIDYRAEPAKRRRRRITTATAAAVAIVTAGLYGLSISGTSLPLFASLPDSTATPPLIPDVELLEEIARKDSTTNPLQPEEVVSGPSTDEAAGLTVGERLKRLDSLMVTVPADSLEGLMAEYEQLLDSALAVRYSERGTPSYARNRTSSTPRSNAVTQAESPRPEGAPPVGTSLTPEEPKKQAPQVRTPAEDRTATIALSTTPESTDKVVEQRPESPRETVSETPAPPPVRQRSNDGYIRSTPSSSRRTNNSQSGTQPAGTSSQSNDASSTSSSVATSSPRSNSSASGSTPQEPSHAGRVRNLRSDRSGHRADRRERMAENERRSRMRSRTPHHRSRSKSTSGSGRTRTKSESLERRYTEGLAQFRAGHFTRALELLRPVASSSASFRNTAKYYVAISLERTGSRQEALKVYRSLRSVGGSIGEKSSIATARLMSALGQTSAARRELRDFTANRRQSRYLTQAEELLDVLSQK